MDMRSWSVCKKFDKCEFCENQGPSPGLWTRKRVGHKLADRDTLSREGSEQRAANMNWDRPIMRKPRGGFLDMEGNNEEKEGAV